MLKKMVCLLLTALFCCVPALAAPAPVHTVEAKGAILYEATTDTILLEQDADIKLFPASTTKLLTAIVAMEYGNPEDMVTVTHEAIDGLYEQGSSCYLIAGEEISFMDLMRYLLIGSGNDAANVLAIHVSGTMSAFVDLMNNRAKELGCTNTHFTNPNGLHDENHYTTARDLLKIALAAMKNETIAQLVQETEVELPVTNKHKKPTTMFTTNHLISRKSFGSYYYEGAIGIKTGTTTPAGRCLVSACVKGDYIYYAVVLGAEKVEGVDQRFTETAKLYDYGAANYSQQVMLSSSEPITQVPVRLSGEKDAVTLRPEDSITAMLPNTFESSDLKISYELQEDVVAPVAAGDVLGKMTVRYGDRSYDMALVSADTVERSTVLYVLDCITGFFSSMTFKIILAVIVLLIVIFIIYAVLINRKRARRRRRRR